ncbi:MAG: hypothetical protein JW700_02245 [Candidatus Aenigmarchaeota archaeon]|nr:hypothetical protein [Candidatus Aenigmarchaeota archaeon]
MKGYRYTLVFLVVALFMAFFGIMLLTDTVNADISNYITSSFSGCGRGGQECCGNDWCNDGFFCSDGICISSQVDSVIIDNRYLILNPYTATLSQRNDYLSELSGSGFELCTGGYDCQNCRKTFEIVNAKNCQECIDCDGNSCEMCISCETAENGNYVNLNDCGDCSGCENAEFDTSNSCSNCGFCNIADVVEYENNLNCDGCYQCDKNSRECFSCWGCGHSQDEKNKKICETCSYSPGNTQCEIQNDKDICERVKECIKNYDGNPCVLEDMIPLQISNGISFGNDLANTITSCLYEDVNAKTSTYEIEQKVCTYDNSNFIIKIYEGNEQDYVPSYNLYDTFTSDSVTGENLGILYHGCGFNTVPDSSLSENQVFYYNNPILFASTTTKKVAGQRSANFKIIIDNVNANEQGDNTCSYDIYVCGQEAIADSDEDTILNIYNFFAYFNESQSDTFDDYRRWHLRYDVDGKLYKINVSAVKYKPFELNVERSVDVEHISNAMVAGIRDYLIFNREFNNSMDFFCKSSGLYMDFEDCFENSNIVINDKMPWSLKGTYYSTDTLSFIPDYRYIYYNPQKKFYSGTFNIELTFYMYTSNIEGMEKTIFVSPVIIIEPESMSDAPPNPFEVCQYQELNSGFISYGNNEIEVNVFSLINGDTEVHDEDGNDILRAAKRSSSSIDQYIIDYQALLEDVDKTGYVVGRCSLPTVGLFSGPEYYNICTRNGGTVEEFSRSYIENKILELEKQKEDAETVIQFIEETQKKIAEPVIWTIGVREFDDSTRGNICVIGDEDKCTHSTSEQIGLKFCDYVTITNNPDSGYILLKLEGESEDYPEMTSEYYIEKEPEFFVRESGEIYANFTRALSYKIGIGSGSGSIRLSSPRFDPDIKIDNILDITLPESLPIELMAVASQGYDFDHFGNEDLGIYFDGNPVPFTTEYFPGTGEIYSYFVEDLSENSVTYTINVGEGLGMICLDGQCTNYQESFQVPIGSSVTISSRALYEYGCEFGVFQLSSGEYVDQESFNFPDAQNDESFTVYFSC